MTRHTSVAVYHQMEAEGLLSARRWEAYKILFEHGPLTSNEVFEYAKLHGNPNYRHNTNARMTELRDWGVAAEIGTKACSVTGNNVILWDVTDQLPTKPLKVAGKPSKQELREAAEELRLLFLPAKAMGQPFSDNLVAVCKWMANQ